MSRSLIFHGLLSWVVVCVALFGCEESDAQPAVASVHPRGEWILEGGAPRIGEVAQLAAVVTAPPGYLAAPLVVPQDVPGFELQGSESEEVLKQSFRWIYRTRLRIRAQEIGHFEWPAAQIEIESTEGEKTLLTLAPLAIEVRSVMAEHAGRDTPYSVIAAPSVPGRGGFARGVAVGGLGVLALLGLVKVVRRRGNPEETRQTSRENAAPVATPRYPWIEAHNALARARKASDPTRAAHIAAETLSLYAAQRFGADTRARTTEELAAATPPLRATSRWPVLVSLLRELDALRFRPATGRDEASAVDLLMRAEAFIEDTTPSENPST